MEWRRRDRIVEQGNLRQAEVVLGKRDDDAPLLHKLGNVPVIERERRAELAKARWLVLDTKRRGSTVYTEEPRKRDAAN